MRFDSIRREKKAYPVTMLCRVMKVSRSGFYDYLHGFNNGSDDSPEEASLKSRVIAIFKEHRGKYVSRRTLKQLKDEGYPVGRYKARRMMRELGLKAKAPRRYKVTTDSGHSFPNSDRGSQYACDDYRKRLDQYKMVSSMSRKGDCWDNASTERFFQSLKSERLSDCRFVTRSSAEIEVLDYISYYNSSRLHSTLGYKTPFEYEKELFRKVA